MVKADNIREIFGSPEEYEAGEDYSVDDISLLGRHSDTIITVEGTCTHFAIERILSILGANMHVVFYGSFEECIQAHQKSRGGVALPLALPMSERIYDNGFTGDFGNHTIIGGPGPVNYWEHRLSHGILLGSGVEARPVISNPPMYFAMKPGRQDIETIACLPELQPWLQDIRKADGKKIIPAQSNIHAAQMVADGIADACITNEVGATKNGLQRIEKTGFKVMDFAFHGRGIEYSDREEWESLKKTCDGLSYIPFPLSNMHYEIFLRQGWDNPQLWSKEGKKWKEEHEDQKPAYWFTHEGIEALKPVTGISFYEAEACAKFFGMRLPTLAEFQFLAGRINSNLIIHAAGFESGSSSRLDIDKTHPLLGNTGKWCSDIHIANEIPHNILAGGSSWDYSADHKTHIWSSSSTRDNNTGIFLVSGNSNSIELSSNNGRSEIGRKIVRPTKAFRQEGNESSELSGESQGRFDIEINGKKHFFDRETLARFTQRKQTNSIFQCVCRWAEDCEVQGVLIKDILEQIGLDGDPAKIYLYFESYPGKDGKTYNTCERLDRILDSATMIITHLKTQEDTEMKLLSNELGGPLRIWSPGLYGYKQTKALCNIRVQNEFTPGWWEKQNEYPENGIPVAGTTTIIGNTSHQIFTKGGILGEPNTYPI